MSLRISQGILSALVCGALVAWSGCAAKTPAASGSAMAESGDKPTAAETMMSEKPATTEASSSAETAEKPATPAQAPAEKPAEKPSASSSKPVQPAEPSLFATKKPEQTPSGQPDDQVVVVQTTKGQFVIELYPGDAPQHVANFKKLVQDRFYEGRANTFHRYEPGFVVQGGDPLGRDSMKAGTGGPGYTVPAEIKRKHLKGSVAAARLSDSVNPKKESSGSQFYICLADLPSLDGDYTVFGQVIQGMESVEKLRIGDEIRKTTLQPRANYAPEQK